MAILSKEEFCHIINEMQENFKVYMQINNVLEQSHIEVYSEIMERVLFGPYEHMTIYLLEAIMNDEEHWISYFCEDYGTGVFNDVNVIGNDGKEYCLNCGENLWEILQLTK